jgi:hypothetical protein
MTKKRKAATTINVKSFNILATMLAEIAEAVEFMRPHFLNDDEDALRRRAEAWRWKRYANGTWPDFAEVAKAEAATDSTSPAQTAE